MSGTILALQMGLVNFIDKCIAIETESHNIFLFGITLFCDLVNGQYIPTVEEGKEWTISLAYGLGSYQYIKYTLCGDTLIQGNHYLALFRDTDKSIVRFVREDTSLQIVYYWDDNAQAEASFLAYKGEAGDTIHLTNGDLVFQEVYYDTLFGSVRKVIVLNENDKSVKLSLTHVFLKLKDVGNINFEDR